MIMLAVFRSRREAIEFARIMSRFRVRVTVVNTPGKIGIPCGLSVKFPQRALSVAERVLGGNDFFGFKGFYSV